MPLPLSTFTIAEAVKKADVGYQTAFFGKWHIGDFWDKGEGNPVSNPILNGFDYMFASEGNMPTATPNCDCEAFADTVDTCVKGTYTRSFCKTYWYQNDSRSTDVQNISYKVDASYNNDARNERNTFFLITKFEEWLTNTADLSKPMLVALFIHAPHTEIVSNQAFYDGCNNGTYCKPRADGTNYTDEELHYWGLIADIDSQIGRLRELLKVHGISNNTWLWFTSDNGAASYSPGRTNGLRGWKNDVWEGGIRVPTIMEWPAVIPDDSFVSDYPVVTHDLLPTLLEVLAVESDTPDWELDGQSILEVLETGGMLNESRKPMGFAYLGQGVSLSYIDMDWKLVENSNGCEGSECDAALYNLLDDPYEEDDLSAVYPDRFESMQDAMQDWYKSVLKSQVSDSRCIVDRLKSYWEYVVIGIAAGIVLCCCILCIAKFVFKLTWASLGTCCFCCQRVTEETQKEMEMATNMDDHEKKPNDNNADTSTAI
eukprot:CAMPEP_0197058720 /NCGR_PEP_ID=MMETSP1384-20130603/110592_1 /TAXON_ID=29189 /ORGANISM="Ammonia sp." /LENGTH=484 /DNA_ID=CAMNT_0042493575 /DNA_START=15 /DNA_END=1469 /DNA_ORIENTATION=+